MRALRDAGLGLKEVRAVLARDMTLADALRLRLGAVEAHIASLRQIAAALRAALRSEPTEHDIRRLTMVTRLSQEERKAVIERFYEKVSEGIPIDKQWMREKIEASAPRLPDEPTPEQVDAWVELAEMVSDPTFVESLRANAKEVWQRGLDVERDAGAEQRGRRGGGGGARGGDGARRATRRRRSSSATSPASRAWRAARTRSIRRSAPACASASRARTRARRATGSWSGSSTASTRCPATPPSGAGSCRRCCTTCRRELRGGYFARRNVPANASPNSNNDAIAAHAALIDSAQRAPQWSQTQPVPKPAGSAATPMRPWYRPKARPRAPARRGRR